MAVRLELICPFCGTVHYVYVSENDFVAYQNGALAQDVFPYLSKEEREAIISGLCPKCQAEIFG